MNPFGVTEDKAVRLRQRMERLMLREQDLEERFVRSGGPGGQNVNKVSTCVVLRHRPTGLEVKVQRERSQALNRFLARRILIEKLEQQRLGVLSEERRRVEKIPGQKSRPARPAKEKMLAGKRIHSLKKLSRQRPSADE